MRAIVLAFPLLLVGCRNAEDEQFLAHFRAEGIRACGRGEGLMRPQWAVPPDRLEETCRCIVTAYMEGKTRRELRHLTVGDQLRARDRCSNGAPFGAGRGDEMEMNDVANAVLEQATEGNASRSGK